MYQRLTLVDKSETERGTTIRAQHLQHIEDGIINNEKAIEELRKLLSPKSASRIGYVTLLANSWSGAASPYSQIVAIDGVTECTQVNLTPSVEQLTIFHQKDLAFITENDDGVVTVYAIGQKPTNDYTIQVTMTEVSV